MHASGDGNGRGYTADMRLTQQQLEAHLWGAANILRGKTAGQDYKNYILSLMFYKRLCDQWEHEADEAIAEQERQQGRRSPLSLEVDIRGGTSTITVRQCFDGRSVKQFAPIWLFSPFPFLSLRPN